MMPKIITVVFLISGLFTQIQAQKVHSTAARFGGECSGTKNTFSKPLASLIRKQRIGHNYQDCLSTEKMCGHSFAFDLNGDRRAEYFVRLGCGATGNCTYGIFEDRPAQLLGKFTAWFFWIDKSGRPWRKITSYSREGGDQGFIQTHGFRRSKYHNTAERTETFNSTQKSFPEKMGMPDCSTEVR